MTTGNPVRLSPSNERVRDYPDVAVSLLDNEFRDAGVPLTPEQLDGLKISRAQFVVDAAAKEIIKKQQEKNIDQERLAAYLDSTSPKSLEDLVGIEHVRHIGDQMGVERRFSTSIFRNITRRLYWPQINESQGSYRDDSPVNRAVRRYKQDDPNLARILKEYGYADILSKDSPLLTRDRDIYGTLLFKYVDIRNILVEGGRFRGDSPGLHAGSMTDQVFEQMCGIIDARIASSTSE